MSFDASAIVPSTRDLLQVIGTRRRSLALVALLDETKPAEHAARLAELNVSAFALASPGEAMVASARATKNIPTLCLTPVVNRDGCLSARFHGANGVCIDGLLPDDAWDKLAKTARTMRMLPIAFASTAEGVASAVKAGARAIVLTTDSVDAVLTLAAATPKAMTLLADVTSANLASLERLKGHVDAAVIRPALHESAAFPAFVAEVDP